jgi:hypothetical protein
MPTPIRTGRWPLFFRRETGQLASLEHPGGDFRDALRDDFRAA